jgi:thiol-disulfide isomerase/thioredoxin
MDNKPQSENELQVAKTSTHSWKKTALYVVGVLAVGTVMALTGKNQQRCGCLPFGTGSASHAAMPEGFSQSGRPRLLDLGAGKCIPCKKMAPILDELKEEYAGRMDVEFIDVWQNRDAASQYGIQSIPTQIFFDASGKELFRHEGFFAKEDILNKWEELGVAVTN